jgi:hypothetical protein
MFSHLLLLVCQDTQRGAWFARTQQYETSFKILGIVTGGVGLINLATVQQTSCARETTTLVAEGWQFDTSRQGSIPDVLAGADLDDPFSLGQQESYLEALGLCHTQPLYGSK